MKLKILFLSLFIFLNTAFPQSTLFLFSFENSTTVTVNNTKSVPVFSSIGALTGPNYYAGSTGVSISYSGWNTGKALLFTTSTKGFDSLSLDYYIRCSNTNVGNFKVQASTDSINWVEIEAPFRPATSFVHHTASLPASFSKTTKIYIQLLKTDDASTTSSNIRLDEVKLTGIGSGPRIFHTPLENSNSSKDRVFLARISGEGLTVNGTDRPCLWYRVNGGQFVSSYFETQNADSFYFRIPAQTQKATVEYYLAAMDTLGVVTYPPGGNGQTPPGSVPPPSFFSYLAYLFGNIPTITHSEIGNGYSTKSSTVTASITGLGLKITGTEKPVMWYRVDGGAFSMVDYSSSSGSDFTFYIPAQPENCTVDYYFAAKDSTSVKTSPSGGGGENPLGKISPQMFYSFHSYNTSKVPGYNVFFGFEHSHTWYSDGNEDKDSTTWTLPVARAIEYARTKANNMDFLGISDHNHMLSLAHWKSSIREIDSTNADDSFVALLGQEWGTGGHIIVPGTTLYGWLPGQYDIYVPQNDYFQLWNVLDSLHGYCYLAHPADHDFQDVSYNPFNAKYDRVIKGTAVLNGVAGVIDTTESTPPPDNFLLFFHRMLALGYHVAPVAEQDNHVTTYGRVNQLRTGVVATSLTKANITNAFRDRRVYATNDHNLKVYFEIGSYLMGDIVTASGPLKIKVKAVDSTPGDTIRRIEIRYGVPGSKLDPTVLASSDNSDSLVYTVSQPNGSNYYYYAYVAEADGNSAWTAPIWVNVTNAAVPVELTSFDAAVNDNTVKLKWTTATETNNRGFEIEKKTPGANWVKLGFVSGNGTSTLSHSYTFSDKIDGVSKQANYRLKQFDMNGTFEYSNEISINTDIPKSYSLEQNYPNPFNPVTTITYQVMKKGMVLLKIYGILGNEIKTLVNEQKEAGKYSLKFDASALASGVYMYELRVNNFTSTKKMILIK